MSVLMRDVVIVGGGMVGASLALALVQAGLSVTVIERQPPRMGNTASFDDRSTALSNSSQRILQGLGLWAAVAGEATPIEAIHVSERGRFGMTRIRAVEEGVPALGYTVINRVLGRILWEQLERCGEVEVVAPAEVHALGERQPGHHVLYLRTPDGPQQAERELHARLLVVCDGADSSVRDMLGIASRRYDYRQTAVIANLLPRRAHGGWAWERFTPEGPMALLPMADQRCGLVWTVAPEFATHLLALDDAGFLAAFQQAFGHRLGRFSRLGHRAAYPLALTRAASITAPRAVILGAAANALHPVAGQGFNLGLRDVAALAEVLVDARGPTAALPGARDLDPGDADLLAAFARWRRDDQLKVVAFTDGLVRGFAATRFPLPVLRSVGMLLFDVAPGAKAVLARHSMGLAGHLPRLVRGLELR
jgi:2-octaprenyl-6-methoxyphenol hydroxylase